MSLQDDYASAEQRLHALQQCPAALGTAESVDWIETHISWLLLAGDWVYKFKKPLKLDFLDFSTQALRRAACEEELRINRRTAPALYQDLVALAGDTHGGLLLLPLAQAPPDAEPAVRMRRFDQAALLSHVLEAQRLTPAHIDALARHVEGFHDKAAVALPGQGWGTAQAVRAPVQDCLAALQPQVAQAMPDLGPVLAQVAQWCAAHGEALAPVFEERLRTGRVRECHGDLHLANLVLVNAAPQLFDAIEFNPALRWIDCVADIAFLAMDLQARGRADLAWRFLNAWLERTGDYAGLQVLDYYRVYRALVRARVAGLRLAQTVGDARAACLQEQQRYLQLALCFTQPRPVALWLAYGFSGSGKSTQSLGLVCQRGMVRVRADVERKRLFGLESGDASSAVPGGIYTADASLRTHDRLAQAARWALQAGHAVLVDATFLNPAMRQRFIALAQELRVPCRILCFEAPLDVLRERVRARQQAGGDASEADVRVLEAQWAAVRPLSTDEEALAVHVDTTQPVDWNRLLPPVSNSGAPA
ncbi:AAA family ATPase [Acidovorax sp.]|uniref:bifunctional aminoglycoside phosphotransferase/ATP-binding protein n=1 Tax=Acidovorax sp. TaxID=1872122 RepID=UPI003BB16B48